MLILYKVNHKCMVLKCFCLGFVSYKANTYMKLMDYYFAKHQRVGKRVVNAKRNFGRERGDGDKEGGGLKR